MENAFSLISQNPLTVGVAVLALLALALNIYLSMRLDRLLKGGNGKSLESTIRMLHEKVEKLEAHATATTATLQNHNGRLMRAIQGVSVKRFDPFQNAGGQQSFAAALLNEKGNGVVISGIHARDGVRVYAKEVAGFKSERELSNEETTAIEEGKSNLKT